MTGGLTDMLGMGLVIQLRNMFSLPAMAVQKSAQALTNSLVGNQQAINEGFKLMAGGASAMLLGSGVMAAFVGLIKATTEASNKLEILHNQIRLLAKSDPVGDDLFARLTQFSRTTPFTIDKVFEGARNLLAMGFKPDEVMKQIKLAGEQSASFPQRGIEEIAQIMGKVRSGAMGYAMRSLQYMGISYEDIAKHGGPVDPKTRTTKRGGSPAQFLEALNRTIEEKFAGGMALYMKTLPGMWSNMKDQLILAGNEIGMRFKQNLKDALLAVLSVFNPDLIQPFAHAVGDGLLLILKMAETVLIPLAHIAVGIMEIGKSHPGWIKMGMAAVFLAGALLNVVGAAMLVLGTFRILQFLLGAQAVANFGTALLGALGPLGWVIAGVALLASIWHYNFFGMQDTVLGWWGSIKLVGSGVLALVLSLANGVGTMPKTLADQLQKAGLMGIVVGFFQVIYRAGYFLKGFWDGLVAVWWALSAVAATFLYVLKPVQWLIEGLWKLAEGLGLVSNKMSHTAWYRWGVLAAGAATAGLFIYGVLLAINAAATIGKGILIAYNVALAIFRGALIAWRVVCLLAAAAQGVLNVAMDANPIGVIILALGLAAAAALYVYRHFNQISNWFQSMPQWVQGFIVALFPMAAGAMLIVKHWQQIKQWFSSFGDWLKNLWDTVIGYLHDKIMGLWDWLSGLVGKVEHMFSPDARFINPNGTQLSEEQKSHIVRQIYADPANGRFAAATAHDGGQSATAFKAIPAIHLTVHSVLDGKVIAKSTTQYQHDKGVGGNW